MLPVVILAGGLATRMKPITEKIPKAMLDIDSRPFIYHQLNLLKEKGINRVILCVGFLGEMIENYVGDGTKFQLDVKYSYDGEKLLGTGGAIKRALKYLDVDYGEIEATFLKAPRKGLMTVYRNDGKWDTSNVVFRNSEIQIYSKKERTEEMNYIDYGLGILNKTVFHEFGEGTVFDLAYVYEKLAEEKQLMGYEVFERFYEIGSKEGLKELQQKISGLS
jgi:N-acetyl-alpha-D-muramate 1-phosphate uridylyltransferase